MQKNSIKILALAALALSLGACGGSGGGQSSTSTSTSEAGSSSTYEPSSETSSEPVSESTSEPDPSSSESESASSSYEPGTLYGIGEILSLDAESQWEHLGERVIVKDLVCQGLWNDGKTLVGGGVLGTSITTLRGLEIHSNEVVAFEHGSGWAALFDVEGTLTDVNGRAVIDDAVVTVTSERIYNESGTGYTGGGSVYYWPAVYMNRGNWDQYLGRVMSGAMLEGVFQIASMPEEITQEQGTSFEVVFPGENLDVEDLDNYSLIEVQVPDGMSAAGVKAFNEYFAEKEVGQFFTYFGSGQYDLVENIGYGLVIDSFGAQFLEDPEEEPEIFATWADVAAAAGQYFNDPLPELGDDRVFSYTYEFGGAATDVILEDYVFLTDKENANCVTINYNYKPADADEIVDDFVAKLETLGWEEQTGDLQGIFLLSEGEECVGELIIDAASETGLSYYYMAAAPEVGPEETYAEFETFAEAKATYEKRAAALVGEGFTSALVDNTTAAALYDLDWSYETYYYTKWTDEIYEYDFTFAYEELPADAEDYPALLAEAGFVAKRLYDYTIDGLFNPETNEFIAKLEIDEEDAVIYMEVFVLSDAAVETYIIDIPAGVDLPTAMADFTAAVNGGIKAVTGNDGAFVSALDTVLGGNTYAEAYVVDDGYAAAYAKYYATYGLIVQVSIEITLKEDADLYESYYALCDALELAEFAYGTLQLFGANGYFNSHSNEFVMISGTDTSLILTVVVLDATSAAYFVAAEAE